MQLVSKKDAPYLEGHGRKGYIMEPPKWWFGMHPRNRDPQGTPKGQPHGNTAKVVVEVKTQTPTPVVYPDPSSPHRCRV